MVVAAPRRLQADLALLAICFIWGSTFVVVKSALEDASPLVFLLLRFALATALLLAIFRKQKLWGQPGLARAGSLIGFFLWAGYVFQTIGLKYTTPAKSAFITALSVVLVPLILVLVLRRRLRGAALVGVGAAAAGSYLLTVPPDGFTMARGDVITFFCAVAFAAHIVAVGHYARRHGVAALAVWQVAVAFLLVVAAVPLGGATGIELLELRWSGRLVFALLVTAVLATAVAFSVQTWAQQFTLPTHTAIIFSLEPAFAAASSYWVFGEVLSGRGLAGAALILAGVLVSEFLGSAPPAAPGVPAAANGQRNGSV
ncbi:MAG: DMT family transporter [Acidobacteria bacterium]|nr:DMT family transporter [Acidobacteriota bacterium]